MMGIPSDELSFVYSPYCSLYILLDPGAFVLSMSWSAFFERVMFSLLARNSWRLEFLSWNRPGCPCSSVPVITAVCCCSNVGLRDEMDVRTTPLSPCVLCKGRPRASWAANGLIIDLIATIDLIAIIDLIESQSTFNFWHDSQLDFGIIRTWHTPHLSKHISEGIGAPLERKALFKHRMSAVCLRLQALGPWSRLTSSTDMLQLQVAKMVDTA